MEDKNHIELIGTIKDAPQSRFTPSGKQVTNLTIVTKHGNSRTFHKVVVWEQDLRSLQENDRVFVAGRLQNRSWEGKNGVKRYVTEVVSSNLEQIDMTPNVLAPNVAAAVSEVDMFDDIPF